MSNIAVILVGGKGTRLRKLTNKTPKPLLEINHRPFLDTLLSFISKSQIKKIYLICSYLNEQFLKKYNKKNILGKKIIIIKEDKKSGTGGALFFLKRKIKSDFVLFNGDSITNIDINDFIHSSKKNKESLINMVIVKNKYYKSNNQINKLNINSNKIVYFKKSEKWMNGGIYLIKYNILKSIKKHSFSFEEKILFPLITKQKVIGYKTTKPFIDIGTPKSFKNSKIFLKENFFEKVIFLDRDGVINKDLGYVHKKKDFHILKGVIQGIKYANSKGYHVICITNQAGVGRGYYNEEHVKKLHDYLNDILNRNNCIIEEFYYCPHHPKFGLGKYKRDCNCRKPKPGMLIGAINKFNINIKKSFMIGDQLSDMQAAKKAKIKFYYKDTVALIDQIKRYI